MPATAAQAAAPAPPVRIAAPDSAEERKADRIADAVMRGGPTAPAAATDGERGSIHRQCADCAVGGPPCADCADDELLMLNRAGLAPAAAPPAAAASMGGGGEPLPAGLRGYFEPRIGANLSAVRLHTGPAAAAAARAINARAYALGPHIAFARGEYAPATRDGRHLIAHELAHVIADDGATVRRDVYDEATLRALTPDDLQPLSMDELDELLAYLRGLYSTNSSSIDDEGIAMNIATVEAEILARSRMTSVPEPPRAMTPARAPAPEPDPLDPDMPEFATGAYAAYSGHSLEHVDSMTHWESEASRRQYQQSYLDWARENNEELYEKALDYLSELLQGGANEADRSGGDEVAEIVTETGLEREFVEAFLGSYNAMQLSRTMVIDPRGVPFIQMSAPRMAAAQIIKDFLPGIGIYEGVTGRDILTGRELALWERILGAALDLLPLASRAISGPARAVVRGSARVAMRTGRSLAQLGHQMGKMARGRLPARVVLRRIGRLARTPPETIRDLLGRIRAARRSGADLRLNAEERQLLEDLFGATGRGGGGRRASTLPMRGDTAPMTPEEMYRALTARAAFREGVHSGSLLRHGSATRAIIQLIDRDGRRIAVAFGENIGGRHAEQTALNRLSALVERRTRLLTRQETRFGPEARRSIEEQFEGVEEALRGGRMDVVVNQDVCGSRCQRNLRDFAEANGLERIDGYLFERPGARPRQTFRTQVSPGVEGEQVGRRHQPVFGPEPD